MALLHLTFRAVSLIFAVSAIATGAQALISPVGFSYSFGLPITGTHEVSKGSKIKTSSDSQKLVHTHLTAYVSLMGVRQFATGITLLTFAYQSKWAEMATILVILGVIVAGTDGLFLWRSGAKTLAKYHAIPGTLIALLAGATLLDNL